MSDVVSVVHRSTDHGKIVFYNNIESIWRPFAVKFPVIKIVREIKFDFSTAVARRLKPSRATAV